MHKRERDTEQERKRGCKHTNRNTNNLKRQITYYLNDLVLRKESSETNACNQAQTRHISGERGDVTASIMKRNGEIESEMAKQLAAPWRKI